MAGSSRASILIERLKKEIDEAERAEQEAESKNLKSPKTTKKMSTNSNLQEKVTAFLVNEVKQELKSQTSSAGFKLDDKKIIPSEYSEQTLKIIVPQSMNKLQAAFNLIKQFEEEETPRTYNRGYEKFFMNDFMVVMQMLIPKYFGMLHVSKINTEGRPAEQDYVQVPVGFDEEGNVKTAKGYVGSILAPVWQDAILDIFAQGYIRVRAKMKFEKQVIEFLDDVERSIRAHSIVKGHSVTIEPVRGGVIAHPIRAKENRKIVLSDDVSRIINNLIIPGMKDSRKASLLFTGDFGRLAYVA